MKKTSYFKLFSSCIPVKGAKRQLICDLSRSGSYFIPEGIYEVLTTHEDKSIEEIKAHYNNDGISELIDKQLDLLVNKELGFFTDQPEKFPKMDLTWETPDFISNAILEVNDDSDYGVNEVSQLLTQLGCRFFEMRFYDAIGPTELRRIISLFDQSKVKNLVVFLPFSKSYERFNWEIFFAEHQRLGTIIVHSCPEELKLDFENDHTVFTKKVIKDNSCCGVVSKEYFSVNLPFFAESQIANSCLNKKLTIAPDGTIKNCPSMKESFGKITDLNLKDLLTVVDSVSFKKYWGVSKDQVKVCQDCEFRYICTDCRAYVQDPADRLSKPAKCGYDPYTGVWEDESKKEQVMLDNS